MVNKIFLFCKKKILWGNGISKNLIFLNLSLSFLFEKVCYSNQPFLLVTLRYYPISKCVTFIRCPNTSNTFDLNLFIRMFLIPYNPRLYLYYVSKTVRIYIYIFVMSVQPVWIPGSSAKPTSRTRPGACDTSLEPSRQKKSIDEK